MQNEAKTKNLKLQLQLTYNKTSPAVGKRTSRKKFTCKKFWTNEMFDSLPWVRKIEQITWNVKSTHLDCLNIKAQCGNFKIFLSFRFTWKRKLYLPFLRGSISVIFSVEDIAKFPHCTVEITEFFSHQRNISSNQLFSAFFSKRCFHEIFVKNGLE